MTLFEIRCCRQCEAVKAYGRLLGICEEWAAYRWCVYGHAARFAKYYKDDGEEYETKNSFNTNSNYIHIHRIV